MPNPVLLTIRTAEPWTPMAIAASVILAVAVVAVLAWGLSVATARYDREP